MSTPEEEEQARETHPTCTCGYWANPIHARQLRVMAERLARVEHRSRTWKKMAKGLYDLAKYLDATDEAAAYVALEALDESESDV